MAIPAATYVYLTRMQHSNDWTQKHAASSVPQGLLPSRAVNLSHGLVTGQALEVTKPDNLRVTIVFSTVVVP